MVDRNKLFVRTPTETGTMKDEDFAMYNSRILDALANVLKNGRISKLDRINMEQITSKKAKDFCLQIFKAINNSTNSQVKANIAFFGKFVYGYKEQLVTSLNKENKILNWPYIMTHLCDPKFDFTNSDMVEMLGDEVNRLKRTYNPDYSA